MIIKQCHVCADTHRTLLSFSSFLDCKRRGEYLPIVVKIKHFECHCEAVLWYAEKSNKKDVPSEHKKEGYVKNSCEVDSCSIWTPYHQLLLSRIKRRTDTHSAKEMSPSLLVSKSMKNWEGAHCNWPGTDSPLRKPSLTRFDLDDGNTGTTARIKSAGVM